VLLDAGRPQQEDPLMSSGAHLSRRIASLTGSTRRVCRGQRPVQRRRTARPLWGSPTLR
jgi:hypothetical protein